MTSEARQESGTGRAELDRWLILVTLLLVVTGLIMVLSSSQVTAYQNYGSTLVFFERQAVGVGIGLVAMAVLSRIDYHRLRSLAPVLAGVLGVLMLLVVVPHVGVKVNGAQRWFNLGPLGTFQPSEFAKLGFTVFLAHWIARRGSRMGEFRNGFLPFLVLLAAPIMVLLPFQRDLGTSVVMSAIFISAYFAGGGRKLHLAGLLVVIAVGLVLVTVAEPFRMARWVAYLAPCQDPLGAGFQGCESLKALGSGGPFGVGLGHSIAKFGWLPEGHTDFIFAIIGEETGLWGTTLVLVGFLVFAIRGYRIAIRAPDAFGVILATAITTWVAFQAVLNMGAVTDTLPVVGVPLPFISYGGTAMAAVLAAVGVLINISGHGADRPGRSIRSEDATFDIGRGDGRAPVAGARRRASVPR